MREACSFISADGRTAMWYCSFPRPALFFGVNQEITSERPGRRTMLMSGATAMIIGSILLGASENLATLLANRIITGIGNGMNSSTAPVYLCECAPGNINGSA